MPWLARCCALPKGATAGQAVWWGASLRPCGRGGRWLTLVVAGLATVGCAADRWVSSGLAIGERVDLGELRPPHLVEASGLAASRLNPGILWAHNDSGDISRIFALDLAARQTAEITLRGCPARDWEDMAAGPGPVPGVAYLYVGDIGDNEGRADSITICRLREPDLLTSPVAEVAVPLRYTYPEGPRDAEVLWLDPLTLDLFVVSKREPEVGVYRAPYPQPEDTPSVLERVATLPLSWVTGGDISSDGALITVKTLDSVYLWRRNAGESVAQALGRPPSRLPYVPEPQGEALAWGASGEGYYTLSEKRLLAPHLYFYPLQRQ